MQDTDFRNKFSSRIHAGDSKPASNSPFLGNMIDHVLAAQSQKILDDTDCLYSF